MIKFAHLEYDWCSSFATLREKLMLTEEDEQYV